jgi:hypothetical protein
MFYSSEVEPKNQNYKVEMFNTYILTILIDYYKETDFQNYLNVDLDGKAQISALPSMKSSKAAKLVSASSSESDSSTSSACSSSSAKFSKIRLRLHFHQVFQSKLLLPLLNRTKKNV